MKVRTGTKTATFSLYSGVKREVSIRELTSRGAEARYGLAKTGEYSLGAVGLPLLAVGTFAVLLTGLLYDTDTIESDHPSRDRDELLILGAGLAGLLLFSASKTLGETANEIRPEVHVNLEDIKKQSPEIGRPFYFPQDMIIIKNPQLFPKLSPDEKCLSK